MLKNPAYSTSVGLLRLGLQLDAVQVPVSTGASAAAAPAKISGMLRGFLKRLLPDTED
jgi:hypothetical protein